MFNGGPSVPSFAPCPRTSTAPLGFKRPLVYFYTIGLDWGGGKPPRQGPTLVSESQPLTFTPAPKPLPDPFGPADCGANQA